MDRPIQTAVVAAAAPRARRELPDLLADAGVRLLRMEQDGLRAWDAVMDLRPNLLVADAELPWMDGPALARRALGTLALPSRPAVLLLRWPEFVLPRRSELEALGARILDKPLEPEGFRAAVEALRHSPPDFSAGELRRADALLSALGVPPHPGRECLKYAALICATDDGARRALCRRVYPTAGELAGLSAGQAERAMRHVIGRAWQSDKFDNQYRIFADTVDATRGQPTCGEMISRLADILRSEG